MRQQIDVNQIRQVILTTNHLLLDVLCLLLFVLIISHLKNNNILTINFSSINQNVTTNSLEIDIFQISFIIYNLVNYQQQSMMEYLILGIVLVCLYIYYRFYYKVKAQIKRNKSMFQKLGYRVYEQQFTFLGLSFASQWEKGIKMHNDALYFQTLINPNIDICIGNIMDKVLIYFVHPDLMKQFLAPNIVHNYPKLQMITTGIKAVFGQGIAFSEGDIWKNKRKLMSKVFNFDLLKENIPKICQICDRTFNLYDQKFKLQGKKYKYDVKNLASKIFNGVVMNCFLGTDQVKEDFMGKKYEEFVVQTISQAGQLTLSPLLVFLGKAAWDLGLTSKIRQVKQSISLMRQKATQIMKQRTSQVLSSPKKEKSTDIIQALIYQKLQKNEQFSFSDKDLIDEFQTFLSVGTDTTTIFFTMMVYYLGKYPQIHKKLRDQINQIILTEDDINYENLKKLTYIDWIQMETTRYYGPADGFIERVAKQDNYIKDIKIKKGTVVSFLPRGTHYNQKYYKKPTEFRPERWEKQCDELNPYTFIGFSSGPRNCIGKQLAHLQSKIALVKLIRRYETIQVPQDITMVVTFLYEPLPFETIFTKSK